MILSVYNLRAPSLSCKRNFALPSSRNFVAVPPDLAYLDSAHWLIQVDNLFLEQEQHQYSHTLKAHRRKWVQMHLIFGDFTQRTERMNYFKLMYLTLSNMKILWLTWESGHLFKLLFRKFIWKFSKKLKYLFVKVILLDLRVCYTHLCVLIFFEIFKCSYLIVKLSITFPTLASMLLAFLIDLKSPSLLAFRVNASSMSCHEGSLVAMLSWTTLPLP